MDLSRLHEAVATACPIDGVRVGNLADKSTWVFMPTATATPVQRAAAQAVIDAFDSSQAAEDAWRENQNSDRKAMRQAAVAAQATNATFIALGAPTNAQIIAQVKALSQQNSAIIRRLIQID